jgi:hypothetical protein
MPLPYNQSTETFTNLNLPDVNFTSNFLKLHNAINSVIPDIFPAMTYMWRMGPNREKSNAYTVVVGKADGKRAL